MKNLKSNKNGMSLLEVTIVLCIAIVMIGFTAPILFKFSYKTKLDSSTNDVISILRTARNYAITNNTDCEVIIPVSQTGAPDYEYKTIKLFQGTGSVIEWRRLKEGIVFDSRTDAGYSTFLNDIEERPFPNDTDPSIKLAVIKFKPNGGVEAGNESLCLRFNNNNLKGKRLVIVNTTGRIEVQDYDP